VEFREAVERLDALVRELEREGDTRALKLLELIDALHRPALERLAEGDLEHPLAQALLAMYDLAPVDERVLADEALDAARSAGATVELVTVDGGSVHVRVAEDDRATVEEALRSGYEPFERLVVDGPPRVVTLPLAAPQYVEVDDVEAGTLKGVTAGDVGILLANLEGDVFAFRNECAVDGMPLDGARLTGKVIVCPWHNCAYDARSGRRVDGEGSHLRPVPVKREDGSVRVAV
jgi:nitrite reductase/ring-hydroxylating ferredoxin subunit